MLESVGVLRRVNRVEGVTVDEVELSRLVACDELRGPCVDKFDESAVTLNLNIPV